MDKSGCSLHHVALPCQREHVCVYVCVCVCLLRSFVLRWYLSRPIQNTPLSHLNLTHSGHTRCYVIRYERF